MMVSLQRLLTLTRELDQALDTGYETEQRDRVLMRVQQLLAERERLLDRINPPFSDDEHRIGRQVAEMNEHIERKMTKQLAILKLEMKQAKKQRQSNRSYLHPYLQAQTADGLYMDRRH